MPIVLHKKAEEEVEVAAKWYEEQQRGLGVDFLEELDRAFIAISEGPNTWPQWPGIAIPLRIRRFLLSRFPYGVAYRNDENQIMIIAVPHLHRRPGYWKKRTSESG